MPQMELFKKENRKASLHVLGFVLAICTYIIYEDLALLFLLIFIPFFIWMIIAFIDFDKVTSGNNYIMLSKKKPMDSSWVFLIFIAILFIREITVSGILFIILVLLYAFFRYTISKRRVFTINTSGIREINISEKKRALSEITPFDIYGNNVEIRFNTLEILQINKNELLHPKWDSFVADMDELALFVKLSQKA